LTTLPHLLKVDAFGSDGRVQVIDRAFALLRALADAPGGMTATALAAKTGIDRSTIHRLLKTLAYWDMVVAEAGNYAVGAGCVLMATSSVNRGKIRRAALPFAIELQEKVLHNRVAIVSLSIPVADEAVMIDRIWTHLTPINLIMDIGDHFPIEKSTSGRAMLSTFDDEACVQRIGQERFDAVSAALNAPRGAQGFATGQGALTPGLMSLAYPIRGRDGVACGAIVIAGLDLQDAMRTDSEVAQHLHRACSSASANLAKL
jgi:DNA-binding IclR family transcriptional regulator